MGRDVLVVIGVGGMGRAIARRMGAGRPLLLADAGGETLDEAAELLRGEGHEVSARIADVSDRASVRALARHAAELGPVTQVAHTAGLSPVQAPAERILRVDLLGVALALEEFGQVIAPGGAAVFVSSMAAHFAAGLDASQERSLAATSADGLLDLPFLAADVLTDPGAAYGVAKRANVLRVQAAAGSWGERGARVNTISPGVVSTPMGRQELAGEAAEQVRALVGMSAAGRMGTPDEVAAAAAFLLGPEAGFITGADLLVDGGAVAAVTSQR